MQTNNKQNKKLFFFKKTIFQKKRLARQQSKLTAHKMQSRFSGTFSAI